MICFVKGWPHGFRSFLSADGFNVTQYYLIVVCIMVLALLNYVNILFIPARRCRNADKHNICILVMLSRQSIHPFYHSKLYCDKN